MRKLIGYLKPHGWAIALIFVLLFGQAMADLSLPAYMSDIVNIGIQQKGIENAIPRAVRPTEFSKITLLMTPGQKSEVTAHYTLLDRSSLSPQDYSRYVKSYPDLAKEPVYIVGPLTKIERESLNATFLTYLPIVAAIEQGSFSNIPGLPPIPPGTDPFSVLESLSPDQLSSLRATVISGMQALPENMLQQYSTAYLSKEYQALGMNLGNIQNAYMFRIGSLMLLLTLAGAAASVSVGFISARVAAAIGRDLRRQLFVRVEEFSNTEFDKFSTASLITRSTNDITQIQMVMVMLFRFVFYAPILAIGGIIRVLGADRSMLWIIAAAVGVMLTMMVIMFTLAIPKFQTLQKLIDKLNLVTREMLTGIMVIRAFRTEQHEEKKFNEANRELTDTSLFVNRILVLMMPVMMLLLNAVVVLIVWVGAHQVDAGTTQVGSMMAFMQYAMQIIFSFLMIGVVFVMIPRASVSAQRVSEVLETEPVIKDPDSPRQFDGNMKGMVEFVDVSFRYPGAEDDVIKNISFIARPGQTTAFIGSTGSGKSTLVNLIPRFYDASSGKVLVDGVDVREVSQHDLREKIGYVSQKAVLFSGTIASNIRYGNATATDEEIARYASIAQATEFIDSSEQHYQTQVAQGATNFSGGQKQRLAIARALAKKPEIYIFDDSLSALDFKTDAALRKALKNETQNATTLIVTQRVSTVMGADQIVVLDNGRIVGKGTHKELMANCPVYREIALSQLSQEELD